MRSSLFNCVSAGVVSLTMGLSSNFAHAAKAPISLDGHNQQNTVQRVHHDRWGHGHPGWRHGHPGWGHPGWGHGYRPAPQFNFQFIVPQQSLRICQYFVGRDV